MLSNETTHVSPSIEQAHFCDLSFEDPGLGKIVIYTDDNGSYHLAGSSIPSVAALARELALKSSGEILSWLHNVDSDDAFKAQYGKPTRVFGRHASLIMSSRANGGALCLRSGSELYVNDFSGDFGRISLKLLQQCAAVVGFKVTGGSDLVD